MPALLYGLAGWRDRTAGGELAGRYRASARHHPPLTVDAWDRAGRGQYLLRPAPSSAWFLPGFCQQNPSFCLFCTMSRGHFQGKYQKNTGFYFNTLKKCTQEKDSHRQGIRAGCASQGCGGRQVAQGRDERGGAGGMIRISISLLPARPAYERQEQESEGKEREKRWQQRPSPPPLSPAANLSPPCLIQSRHDSVPVFR